LGAFSKGGRGRGGIREEGGKKETKEAQRGGAKVV
jgi:hypothetical protein